MTTLRRWLAVVRKSIFLKWAFVVVALGVSAVGIIFRWGFLKWAAVAVAVVVSVVGISFLWRVVRKPINLLWGAVRKPIFLNWAFVVVALGVSAVGIYFLWGFLKWAAVAVALGVSAVGVYLLWRVVRCWSLFLKWAAVAVALGVCAVGILLLWGVWDGEPVAAAFTRVGGATRVETALEASRFWLTPPQFVVETRADASQQIMLGAAQCAVAHDAPLLFTSPDPQRQRLVNATLNDWRRIETPISPARPEMVTIRSQRDIWRPIETALPEVITIQGQSDVTRCRPKAHLADIAGLSTLEVPNPLIPLPQVRPRRTLASVVVFAAAIEPGDPPDVAVGLALAAHMARANREDVSLVVVPHYLESDVELKDELQSQHELVTGGVVLGESPTVPEDTRALLRQLLTSTDRQGVLAQVQANLGSVGSLIAALLALAGVAAASRIAGPVVIERLERFEREHIKKEPPKGEPPKGEPPMGQPPMGQPPMGQPPMGQPPKGQPPKKRTGRQQGILVNIMARFRIGRSVTAEPDWLIALGRSREVTIWLRSGREVAGTIERQIPGNAREPTVFRIKKKFLPPANGAGPPQGTSPPIPKEKYALVSVKDIETIHFNDPEPEPAPSSHDPEPEPAPSSQPSA